MTKIAYYGCRVLSEISDSEFKKIADKLIWGIEEGNTDCLMKELERRDMVIKISKNLVPFVSKVTRHGKAQEAFAEKFGRKR